MTKNNFDSIPQGVRKQAEEGMPLGEVAVMSLDRRTSAKGITYTHSATVLTPDGVEHVVRVFRTLGRQLASLESLPCRVTVKQVTSEAGRKYKTLA